MTYTLDEARRLLPQIKRFLGGLRQEFVAMKHHELAHNKGKRPKSAQTHVEAAKSRSQQWLKMLHDLEVGVWDKPYRGIALIPAVVPGSNGPTNGYYVYYDTRDDITGYVDSRELGDSCDLNRFIRQMT